MNYMNTRNCMSNMNIPQTRQSYTSMNANNCNSSHTPVNTNTCNTSCTPANTNTCNAPCTPANNPKHTSDCYSETVYTREVHMPEIPTGNQKQLFNFINEVSFAAYETLLFLDTHPDDKNALAYFHKHNHLRNAALKEYAKHYGPLTISTADDCSSKCWEWMNQPWPWEGGIC